MSAPYNNMNDKNPTEPRTILLWGDTETGKSSLIAAALFDDPEKKFPSIETALTGAEANAAGLNERWRDLREGRPGVPTVDNHIDVRLHRRSGTPVLLRDIRGGLVDLVADATILQIAQSADVILFVMDFRARDAVRQLRAIDGIWNTCSGVAKGLVFTKCELHLDCDHRAWKVDRHWWREFQELRGLSRYIERFGDAVFPTSVYGYDPGSMFPALTLGEFGELRPVGITPYGVVHPFAWALKQVDMHDRA